MAYQGRFNRNQAGIPNLNNNNMLNNGMGVDDVQIRIDSETSLTSIVEKTGDNLSLGRVPQRQNGRRIRGTGSNQVQANRNGICADILFQKVCKIVLILLIILGISNMVAQWVYDMIGQRQGMKNVGQIFGGQLLVDRKYKQGQVLLVDGFIQTQLNSTRIVQVYRLIYVVNYTDFQRAKFVGYLQKRREDFYDVDGNKIREFVIDESDSFEEQLLQQMENCTSWCPESQIIPQDGGDEVNLTDQLPPYFNDSDQNTEISHGFSGVLGNDTNETKQRSSVPLFRIQVYCNGTISSLVFHSQTNETDLSLFKCFSQIFFPFVGKNVYIKNQGQNILNESGNFSRQEKSGEFESSVKNFETDDENTYLSNKNKIQILGQDQNTQEQIVQNTRFSNQGEFKDGSIESTSKLKNVRLEQNDKYKVLNLQMKETSLKQKVDMKINGMKYLKELNMSIYHNVVIDNYKDKMRNMTLGEIKKYIQGTGLDEDQNLDQNSSRLLYQSDKQLLFSYSKMAPLFKTNIFSIAIQVHQYNEISIIFTNHSENKYRLKPRLMIEIGTVIMTGSKMSKIASIKYDKYLPFLSYEYTLIMIKKIRDSLHNRYIEKVTQLKQSILDGFFEGQFVPKVKESLDLIRQIEEEIRKQEGKKTPIDSLNKIFGHVENIQKTLLNKGGQMLGEKQDYANALSSDLFEYHKNKLVEALQDFREDKIIFRENSQNGSEYLREVSQNFTNVEVSNISEQMNNLVPDVVNEEFQKQMQIARPARYFYEFVHDKGLEYIKNMQDSVKDHEQNLVRMNKGVIDLYFRNQSLITEAFRENVNSRYNLTLQEVRRYEGLMEDVNVTNMNLSVLNLFKSMVFEDFLKQSAYNQVLAKLKLIGTYVNGISREKGECCKWKRKWYSWVKYCAWYNQAIGMQSSQPYYFRAFQTVIKFSLPFLSTMIKETAQGFDSVIKNGNGELVQIFEQLKIQQQRFIYSFDVSQITQVVNKVSDSYNRAINVRKRITCGGRGNLNRYISDLDIIRNIMIRFRDRHEELRNVSIRVVNLFVPQIYTAILENTYIVESVYTFFNRYEAYEEISLWYLERARNISQTYDAREFMKSNKTANQVFKLYGDEIISLNELCVNRAQNQSEIMSIRGQFEEMHDNVNNLSDVLLGGELSRLNIFLWNASNSIYQDYLSIPFCQTKEQFELRISSLYQDFNNFTILYDLYDNWQQINVNVSGLILPIKNKLLGFNSTFYSLFTADGYKGFANDVSIVSQNLLGVNDYVSLQLSRLREKSKFVHMFQMASQMEISVVIKYFNRSQFIQDTYEMFPNLTGLHVDNLNILKKIGYDVIAFTVACSDVKKYFELSMDNYRIGSEMILRRFDELSDKVLDLDEDVSQKELNEINRGFGQMMLMFNSSIFGGMDVNKDMIVERYKGYGFNSSMIKYYFNLTMNNLSVFYEILEDKKDEMYLNMDMYVRDAIEILNGLEIGSLNVVYELGQVVKNETQDFMKGYAGVVGEIMGFKDVVDRDFRRVYEFEDFYGDLKKRIVQNYDVMYDNVVLKIDWAKKEFLKNGEFYDEFKKNEVNVKMQGYSKFFEFNFKNIWDWTQPDVDLIRQIVNTNLTGNTTDILRQINDAKQIITNLNVTVQNKIKSVRIFYQQIRMVLFGLQNMNFIDIDNEMNEIVILGLSRIGGLVNDLVENDLIIVYSLARNPLNGSNQKYRTLVSKLVKLYEGQVKNKRLQLNIRLFDGEDKAFEFLIDKLIIKLQRYRSAQIYIKSLTNIQDPIESEVLLQKVTGQLIVGVLPVTIKLGTFIGFRNVQIMIQLRNSVNGSIRTKGYRNILIYLQDRPKLSVSFLYTSSSLGSFSSYAYGYRLTGNIFQNKLNRRYQVDNFYPISQTQEIENDTDFIEAKGMGLFSQSWLQVFDSSVSSSQFYSEFWYRLIYGHEIQCIWIIIWVFCFRFEKVIGYEYYQKTRIWDNFIMKTTRMQNRVIYVQYLNGTFY